MAASLNVATSNKDFSTTDFILNLTQTSEQSTCVVLSFEGVLSWDNPDSLIRAHTEDLVRRMSETVVLPLLFLIGGPANIMNMAVFRKQGLKERINVSLFSLALADLLYLINSMLVYGEQIHIQLTTKKKLVFLFVPEMRAGGRRHNVYFAGLWLLNTFPYINATFNIAVYYTMGSQYRHTFWQLLGRSNKTDSQKKGGITTTTGVITSSEASHGTNNVACGTSCRNTNI